jgi:nicotinate-nucleotide adenylyltransferase
VTRLGLLGGTFDPPHYGHLVAANEVAWRLKLDQVLLLPAHQNPLKSGAPSSSAEARCEMVNLAVGDNPLLALSRLDVDRPPPSFTVDLLKLLDAPDRQLFFLVGADILPELHRWRAPEEILRLARLVVVNRPGAPEADLQALPPGARERVELVPTPGVDIASRDLRQRVRTGKPIRYLTPPDVERYILEHRLYTRHAV